MVVQVPVRMGTDVVPAAGDAWSTIARKDAVVPAPTKVTTSSVRGRDGLSTLVVDANAIIGGGSHLLSSAAGRFFTVQDVLDEVRDPQSRMQLAALPLTLEVMEPDQEAVTKVVQFSRATGDLQSLSEVDMKLIALAYTLESQAHGTAHLRTRPPPLQVTPIQKHRLHDPPGWGANISNLKEWEELPEEDNKATKSSLQNQSKILGLKYLKLDGLEVETDVTQDTQLGSQTGEHSLDVGKSAFQSRVGLEGENVPADLSVIKSEGLTSTGNESQIEKKSEHRGERPRQEKPAPKPKPVISIEGKSNVAVGMDASKTEITEEDSSDWMRACSRTTRRKYLKREARRNARNSEPSVSVAEIEATETKKGVQRGFFDEDVDLPSIVQDIAENSVELASDTAEGQRESADYGAALAGGDVVVREEERESSVRATESNTLLEEDEERALGSNGDEEDTRAFAAELAAHEAVEGEEDGEESIAGTDGGDYVTSVADGTAPSTQAESEESWSVRPFWQSSVACVTGDFAMQNVILQMGLRLLSPTGVHVRELHRWVLKCTACGKITPEVGRIFCPKCGNGGTLYKVSVTVGANGSLHAGRIRRVNLRGTRYSLPKPKGGREGAAQNPILREDQLPQRVLHPRQRKSSAEAGGDALLTMDTLFLNKAQNLGTSPQIREATAVFGGRRNPNERRVARKH